LSGLLHRNSSWGRDKGNWIFDVEPRKRHQKYFHRRPRWFGKDEVQTGVFFFGGGSHKDLIAREKNGQTGEKKERTQKKR